MVGDRSVGVALGVESVDRRLGFGWAVGEAWAAVFKDADAEVDRSRGIREFDGGVARMADWRFGLYAGLPLLATELDEDMSSRNPDVEEAAVGRVSCDWERSIVAKRLSSSAISCSRDL